MTKEQAAKLAEKVNAAIQKANEAQLDSLAANIVAQMTWQAQQGTTNANTVKTNIQNYLKQAEAALNQPPITTDQITALLTNGQGK